MWAGAADAAGKVLVFVATLVLARLLVPSRVRPGRVRALGHLLLEYVGDLGLGAALIYRSDADDPRVSSTAFWMGMGGRVLFAARGSSRRCWRRRSGRRRRAALPRTGPAVPVLRARQGPRVPPAALAAVPHAVLARARRRPDEGRRQRRAGGRRSRRMEPRDRPARGLAVAVGRAVDRPPLPPGLHDLATRTSRR